MARRAARAAVGGVVLIGIAALGRVIGLPVVVVVATAVALGFIASRSLSPCAIRRTTPARLLGLVAIMIALSASTWSYTGALTDPGSDPVIDRTANWMRDHHLNLVVDTIEQRLDSQSPTTDGTIDAASLPNTPTAATPTPPAAASPTPATGTAATTAPVTASAAQLPPPAGPLIDKSVAGEGRWTANARQVNGTPVTYTTFVRPDPTDTGVVAAAVLLDPTATQLVYTPGTVQPGGTGWAWNSSIPAGQRPNLVAAFNAGWKQRDHPGGIYSEGRTAVPLVDGRASLVIYADGHSDIGAWGSDLDMGPDVVSVVQNLDPVVADSRPVDGLARGGSGRWGTTKYQTQISRRSGLGITADGALVYVSGRYLTTNSLAHALMQVGSVRALELDIHKQHPTFNFYTPAPGTANGVTGEKLLTEQYRPATRYLQPDQRDFFAVLTR